MPRYNGVIAAAALILHYHFRQHLNGWLAHRSGKGVLLLDYHLRLWMMGGWRQGGGGLGRAGAQGEDNAHKEVAQRA